MTMDHHTPLISWTRRTKNTNPKCQALSYYVTFHAGHANLYCCDFPCGTFDYCDPEFPDNLIDKIRW